MGLLTGAASLTRFAVSGDLPDSPWEFIAERIARHSFRDIDDSLEEFSVGWVSVADMFDSSFAYSSYAAGDYVALTMRADERRVSPAVLNKFCRKEEERLRRERQVPRLPKAARVEIRERVQAELLRKSPPIPATYDLCWNLGDGVALFFSTSKKAIALLEDLFKESFGLALVLQIPWLAGERMLDEATRPAFDNLQPAVFL